MYKESTFTSFILLVVIKKKNHILSLFLVYFVQRVRILSHLILYSCIIEEVQILRAEITNALQLLQTEIRSTALMNALFLVLLYNRDIN